MDYQDFLMRLENIAIDNQMRLVMERAPVGCGFFFYFITENGNYRTDYRVLLINHTDLEVLFSELERLASELRKELDA